MEEVKAKTFNRIKEFRESTKGQIKFGFFDIVGMRACFWCCKRFSDMKKIYDLGEEKLSVYLDYLEIVKLLQEFDKLKKTNFDEDQGTIFKSTAKPRFFKKDKRPSIKSKDADKDENPQNKDVHDIEFYYNVYNSYGKIKWQL